MTVEAAPEKTKEQLQQEAIDAKKKAIEQKTKKLIEKKKDEADEKVLESKMIPLPSSKAQDQPKAQEPQPAPQKSADQAKAKGYDVDDPGNPEVLALVGGWLPGIFVSGLALLVRRIKKGKCVASDHDQEGG